MKRHGTKMMQPGIKMTAFYSWVKLGDAFDVPAPWLRVHCLERLKAAEKRNGDFEFNLEEEPREKLKGKMVIPVKIQKMLIKQELLQLQAHLSLEQRCADIKDKFQLTICVKTLRLIYDLHRVKMKKIMTITPKHPPHLEQKRIRERRKLKYDLEYLAAKKIKLYFLDEATFTSRGYNKYGWSNVGENVLIDFNRAPPYVSCAAIISQEGLYQRSIIDKAFK
jgi:hypothetical protein